MLKVWLYPIMVTNANQDYTARTSNAKDTILQNAFILIRFLIPYDTVSRELLLYAENLHLNVIAEIKVKIIKNIISSKMFHFDNERFQTFPSVA